jgi:hypothetical protein
MTDGHAASELQRTRDVLAAIREQRDAALHALALAHADLAALRRAAAAARPHAVNGAEPDTAS